MSRPQVTLAILGMPGVQLLDACGPLDVFAEADRQTGYETYRLLLLACEPGPLVSSSGTRLIPDAWIGEEIDPIDTLLQPQARPLSTSKARNRTPSRSPKGILISRMGITDMSL
ncbi:type 1 glutamine amidotransferase family protein [Metapseudomonas lalkuanensis]|uniref:hypothetical protein n=1 Tax=Metapseudomonas lalkuanensis TaxID=2604832 RepID=UPI001FCED61F|nr:hypothetical protein [Pseudomonas lalkuanensis]